MDRAWITDDDELPPAFGHVKAAATHLDLKSCASDPRFDITHGAAHHAAFFGNACCENLLQPLFVIKGVFASGHVVTLTQIG